MTLYQRAMEAVALRREVGDPPSESVRAALQLVLEERLGLRIPLPEGRAVLVDDVLFYLDHHPTEPDEYILLGRKVCPTCGHYQELPIRSLEDVGLLYLAFPQEGADDGRVAD